MNKEPRECTDDRILVSTEYEPEGWIITSIKEYHDFIREVIYYMNRNRPSKINWYFISESAVPITEGQNVDFTTPDSPKFRIECKNKVVSVNMAQISIPYTYGYLLNDLNDTYKLLVNYSSDPKIRKTSTMIQFMNMLNFRWFRDLLAILYHEMYHPDNITPEIIESIINKITLNLASDIRQRRKEEEAKA